MPKLSSITNKLVHSYQQELSVDFSFTAYESQLGQMYAFDV